MPATLKRKGSPSLDEDEESTKRRFAESDATAQTADQTIPDTHDEDEEENPTSTTPAETSAAPSASAAAPSDPRAARFAALRARNQDSRKENLRETRNETRRAAVDPSQLTSVQRKKDVAAHKLLKADTEASGEDFERKRAWDWTVEESARWDERLEEKKRKKDANGFASYGDEAGKVYERQVGMMNKGDAASERRAAYEREKREAIERSVKSGGLEIVETETGELIAVDKDGTFYSTGAAADGAEFGRKTDKAAVDRLVGDIKRAEEMRLKKRKERGLRDEDDGGDTTFINEKNKQFNMKLARFYDKYTAGIRESFERGTAI